MSGCVGSGCLGGARGNGVGEFHCSFSVWDTNLLESDASRVDAHAREAQVERPGRVMLSLAILASMTPLRPPLPGFRCRLCGQLAPRTFGRSRSPPQQGKGKGTGKDKGDSAARPSSSSAGARAAGGPGGKGPEVELGRGPGGKGAEVELGNGGGGGKGGKGAEAALGKGGKGGKRGSEFPSIAQVEGWMRELDEMMDDDGDDADDADDADFAYATLPALQDNDDDAADAVPGQSPGTPP